MKRHHFRGGPKTHGQSDRHRAPGSIGAGTFPGRVLKGLKMAGHMGNARVTVRNLEVVEADAERNLLLLKGAVPGARNSLIIIRKSGRGQAIDVKLELRNIQGDVVREIEVRDDVFGAPLNRALVHQVMVGQLANARQGTANTKTRAEVSGGGRKPRPQKGTGRGEAGYDSGAPLEGRRSRHRPEAEELQPSYAKTHETSVTHRRPLRQGARGSAGRAG